ncbi:MAG: methylenetetrahydrofolate--tRNA-(uracil(54)-C(5))-methyltransferase (FADH(2)-oxidizing) TrmFO [Alphaproteobacteria bacterium]|nr:methylenetetrahydrofolate--tRNA-(uracil(54)-C(5))-methyltransferase (FADH(2)-oxidizing) TrmFO [Alphaproteobacteria bacterium]
MHAITIIGAGLAGSEAAYQLLKRGFSVRLVEMRPDKMTPAHTTKWFGELVCSNSLRSDDNASNAVGLLHDELRRCDSLIMRCADACAVPAGGALAVNREDFARMITETLTAFDTLTLETREADLPTDDTPYIIATGPLTSDKMAADLQRLTGEQSLHFFDAVAPIVFADSVDMAHAWYQSRYDKGDGTDYLNCALTKQEYGDFIDALLAGARVAFRDWEKDTPYFEGCLPVEVMAERGRDTLRFGPMKPVGLTNPHEGRRPYAVVQLRKENRAGTLMNMVGFQTKMTYGAQKEVFRMIPALRHAEFARLGGIHRNTFVCGPKVLDARLTLRKRPNIRLAGQLTGCEGYVESTAVGLLAGLFSASPAMPAPPRETALGAMLTHITQEANADTFQPMNINFGLFPEVAALDPAGKKIRGADRKKLYTARAKDALRRWVEKNVQ